ncbi:MAG: peptide chain release factor-like protein [Candidatus Eisenbacteria bacterium]|uniref:Peptide chain release factor-like protein n=1 Tax=Eiseniibacteriota bacterium TaxID=2212470 RepID=A0A538U749_UNCEI|nr:MAG: peptide chain release factor-like protein [Candidatus Eisenbacteria bacterium]
MPLAEHLKRLLKDCDVEPYKSSGPGGQKKNKTESSVRIRHRPTGLVRIATESRSQARNRLTALERLHAVLAARARRRVPRIATRPTAAARRRRVETKQHVARKKDLRRSPEPE